MLDHLEKVIKNLDKEKIKSAKLKTENLKQKEYDEKIYKEKNDISLI